MTAPAAEIPPLRVPTPKALGFLYDPPLGAVRYRGAYGGRGKGASWNFARALIVHGYQRPLRILCAREFQSSIKDSVYKLLTDQIVGLGLRSSFRAYETTIVGVNGTSFIFKGIRKDIAQIKSMEGIDICWVEEAESVTDESWQALIPTIRRDNSEIWVSFNPLMVTDATYKRFVLHPPARSIIRKLSWRDNPWMPRVLHEEREELLRTDPEAHAHVWEGEPWTRSDAQVLSGKWVVNEFEPDLETWSGPYFGADWGFARDPSVLVRLWIYDKRLYIDYEAGGVQLDNDQTAEAFKSVPGAVDHEIRADSARPETIAEMCKRGLRVVAAPKWEGSVKDGIAHLRTYTEIVIHPRCSRTIQEARLWRYKIDARTNEVRPQLQPGFDHTWDAGRYALAPLIQERGVWVL